MPGWAIFALVCAALTAMHRPLIQQIQWQVDRRNGRPLDGFVLVSTTFSGVVMCVLMSIMFVRYGVPDVKMTFWLWIGLAGLIQFVGLTQATAAFARGSLSRLVSLNALLPVVQTGLGWLLRGEWLSYWQMIGILTVAVGMLLRPRADEPTKPATPTVMTALTDADPTWVVRVYRWTQAAPGRQYAIALSTWPLYAFALKPALASVQPRTPAMPFIGASMVMGIMAVLGLIRCICAQRVAERKARQHQLLRQSAKTAVRLVWRDIASRAIIALFVTGALVVGAQQFCDLMAYATGKIAAVASLMETAIVFNLPMTVLIHWLGNRVGKKADAESDSTAESERKLGITPMTIVSAIVITAGAVMIGR